MNNDTERDGVSDRDVLEATLRFNTLVFSIILGVFAGASLLALSLVAQSGPGNGRLAVALIGVFLPGYGADWPGALLGLFWGFMFGALLGVMIYRINSRNVLEKIDQLVIAERGSSGFTRAVLRLEGHSLGLAIGAVGALGLVTTTNMLVVRGTAAESVHARLLSEVLPGYTVSVIGSIIGAIELFAVLYVFCRAFAAIYNWVAGRRQQR
jgi:hypothetical protein